MATQEEIRTIVKLIIENRPKHPHIRNQVDDSRMGIGAVMQYLDQNEKVTAGQIANELQVSTARVAVLLKKMESKGLISKGKDEDDARITIVQLTNFGKENISQMKQHINQMIEQAIDKIGYERLLDFIEVSKELREILPKPEEGCVKQYDENI